MATLTKHGNDTFRYDTGDSGRVVRLQVFYHKGGLNWATYKNDRRGIYISLNEIDVEKHDGYTSVTFTMFSSGAKLFVQETARLNAKQLQQAADVVAPFADEITALFAFDRSAAFERLKSLFAVPTDKAVR